MKMLRGGVKYCVCVCSEGFEKSKWGQGESVKSGYRTEGLILWAGAGSLCRDPGTLIKRNKNQPCDCMTT